jgi:hypothetical protein
MVRGVSELRDWYRWLMGLAHRNIWLWGWATAFCVYTPLLLGRSSLASIFRHLSFGIVFSVWCVCFSVRLA